MSHRHEVAMNLRVYFTVPFADKDEAKELGCRWDPDERKWYCIDSDKGRSNVSICARKWHTPRPYKMINGEEINLSEIPDNNRGYSI